MKSQFVGQGRVKNAQARRAIETYPPRYPQRERAQRVFAVMSGTKHALFAAGRLQE
jgi:hypothetical protein